MTTAIRIIIAILVIALAVWFFVGKDARAPTGPVDEMEQAEGEDDMLGTPDDLPPVDAPDLGPNDSETTFEDLDQVTEEFEQDPVDSLDDADDPEVDGEIVVEEEDEPL